jgi:amino acid adenylation domain-containing protein
MSNQISREETPITRMSLDEAEFEQVLVTWNRTERDHPSDVSLQDLFEAQVSKSPDLIAVTHGGNQLTYRELDVRANQLAHQLQRLGVGPEVRVGICMKRSPGMLIGMLGILKAGGAYVPLDPKYPQQRLAFMLEDAGVRVLLTEQSQLGDLPEHDAQVVCLDDSSLSIDTEPEAAPARRVNGGNLAYIIYTSGSTGRPKGVAIEHRSAVSFSHWAREVFTDEELAGTLALTSICFDLSIFELLVPLHWGGKVILIENALELSAAPEANQVTLINCVPSAIAEILRLRGIPASVHTINLAGEALSNKLVQQLYENTQVKRVFNLYGPTEDTTYSTWALMKRGTDETPPIGRPVHNTRVYLLGENGQPVPIGEPGELHLGGAGLARGYWRRPELTAAKFIPDPFSNTPGSRLYCTGDLARYRKDGQIEYLGRRDQQVKIRGFRIELGEVEAALVRHSGVRDGIVVVREDEPDNRRLVAYVIGVDGHRAPAPRELRHFLTRSLPEHMVPSAFVTLTEMPLTPNGKIDRSALPRPETLTTESDEGYVSPSTPVEESLAGIWANVLGLARIGVEDNFFELGGHSLLATRVIAQAREKFQVEVPIRAFFDLGTVSRMAEIIESNRRQIGEMGVPALVPVSRNGKLPLSFSQERVWFIEQLYGSNLAYQFQSTLRFNGVLDLTALERSLNEIVSRHEIFRTTFPIAEGRPMQLIHPAQPVALPLHDLSGLAETLREGEAQRLAKKEFQRVFDINQLPLVRWTLIRFNEHEHMLLHVEHHLLHDGWSFNRFLHELLELYSAYAAGEQSPLTAPTLQFADFACWQRQLMEGELAERQLAYWTRKLDGCPRLLGMPFDRARPAVQSLSGNAKRVELPVGLTQSLRELSRRQGGTLFMTMLGAFLTMLHRYTGQEDICIGSGVANRRWLETEQLLGMIVNLVAMRADLSGDPTFRELLSRVRDMTLEAYENQDLPFDRVVDALEIDRNLSYPPLYQILFSFHDSPMPDLKLRNVDVKLVEAVGNGSAKYDLNIIGIPRDQQQDGNLENDNGFTLIWEYNTDLFDEATIDRMIAHYRLLLVGMVANVEQRVSQLSLLEPSDREEMVVTWNDTARKYPATASIQELFEGQVERAPEAVAISLEDEELSYAELNRRANQLAHYLRKLGVGPDVRVGIMMERSIEMVVGLLGILKAGGAYVPLDSSYPPHRLAFLAADAGLRVLLTTQQAALNLGAKDVQEVCLDLEAEMIGRESEANPTSGVVAENLAYVIYTSGSTGLPKGVAVDHRAVLRLVCGADYIDFNAGQVFLQAAPISFDASTFELWGALLNGARCVLLPQAIPTPEELGHTIKKHRVSIVWLTSALFNHVMNEMPEALSGVERLLIGGEIVSVAHVQQALRLLPLTQIINCYGPTESTTFTSCYHIPRQLDLFCGSISIGWPIANTEVYVVDQYLQPVPVGIYGELLIGGPGLARGYLNHPELTAEKFIPHPFNGAGGARLYRTGDLVRYLVDGNIEFAGRRDQQVKIRGFRIELGEVEAALCTHEAVRQAVVVARADERGERRLVAYVIEAEEVSGSELRAHLKERLPDYMLPALFVTVAEMPLTANGKVDRERLPQPEGLLDEESGEYVAPQTAIEEVLAGIWGEVLGVERVSRQDNFFDIGGHSLLATRVISWVRKVFKVELALRTLFEEPTVAGLAAALEAQSGEVERLRRTAELLLSLMEPVEAEVVVSNA